jgi:hypothetical protein
MTAVPPVWGTSAAHLAEHLVEQSRDESGWTRVLQCPATGAEWLEDYPFSELQGGGPTRLRPLPLSSPCVCRTVECLAGDDAAAYQREHLVWVRHLADSVNLWVCSEGLAVWDDQGTADEPRLLSRVWLTNGPPLRPLLAYSVSRGW